MGFALDLLEFAFGIQDFEFVGLNLRDSCFPRVEGTRGDCGKEAPLLIEACLDAPAALSALGCPECLSRVGPRREEPLRNVVTEPLTFRVPNVYSPSSFLVKSVQVELS